MKSYSRLYAGINLDHIVYNMEQMKEHIHPETKIIGVIKADGYGHGAIPIARVLEEMDYVWGYATATPEEAFSLKKAGLKKPILVLGCVFPEQYEEVIKNRVRFNVYTLEMAQEISNKAVEMGLVAHVHVKLDTGMSRLGFVPGEDSVDAIEEISHMEGLHMEGIFTHFSRADETNKTFTDEQLLDYSHMLKRLKERKVIFDFAHCSNSAGIIDLPMENYPLVRAGISIYGLYPSEEVNKKEVDIKPVMEIKTRVIMVKNIKPGTPVSYGGTFIAPKEMRIATVSIGYADGYPRSLSNKGYVLIRGEKARILGRVCMDQMMVDVTEIPGVEFGEEVTIVGKNREEIITVEDLSSISGRFNYEFVCDITKRVPRVYYRNGEVVETIDYFS